MVGGGKGLELSHTLCTRTLQPAASARSHSLRLSSILLPTQLPTFSLFVVLVDVLSCLFYRLRDSARRCSCLKLGASTASRSPWNQFTRKCEPSLCRRRDAEIDTSTMKRGEFVCSKANLHITEERRGWPSGNYRFESVQLGSFLRLDWSSTVCHRNLSSRPILSLARDY